MGATFPRLKNWGPEVLSNTDLNAEIDNILNNLGPGGIDDYSTNTTQMRLTTDPGTAGAESLATSLAGEIERLRFVIKRMLGSSATYWYDTPATTLADIVASFGNGLPRNRIVSCATTSRSSQPLALIPNGAAASLLLDGTPTPFVYYVDGVQYTISSDVTITGLGLAPSTNNTATANLPNLINNLSTKPTIYIGMYGTTLSVDAMGSELTSRVGQICAFKKGTEYFIGTIKSSTEITNCVRGCFWDSTSAAMKAVAIADNDTITLMRLTWVFATTTLGLAVTYNNPVVSAVQPTSPSTGDYWFDLSTNQWKIYNSTAYVAANATLIGLCVQDTSNCVAARTLSQYTANSDLNNIKLDRNSATVVQCRNQGSKIQVFGTTIKFGNSRPMWDIASHLDTGLSEASDTYYYLYLKETGAPVISDQPPTDRRDLEGLYHPTEHWRAVGWIYNNTSSDFIGQPQSFCGGPSELAVMGSFTPYGTNLTNVIGEPDTYYAFPNAFKVSTVAAGAWPAASGAYADLISMTLDPGTYWVKATVITFNGATPPTATIVGMGVSCHSGNSFPELVSGYNSDSGYVQANALERHTLSVSFPIRVEYSGATVPWQGTTIYLKLLAATVGSNLQVFAGSLIAWRIDNMNGVPA